MMVHDNQGALVARYPREGYGFGAIRLTWKLASAVSALAELELINATDTQGALRDRGTFDRFKQGLHLPDDYIIHGIYIEPLYRTWCVLVEAPGVPIPHEGEELPSLTPIYEIRFPDGDPAHREVVLLRVDVATDPYMVLRADPWHD